MDPHVPPSEGVEDVSAFRRTASAVVRWCRRHLWLLLFVGAGLVVLMQIVLLPFGELETLSSRVPEDTALMREHAHRAASEGHHFRKRQTWVSLRNIPDDLVLAVIVSEDASFWGHDGFDWYEFRVSVERNLREGKVARGASTITQQLVKNLYLSSSKNPLRKLKEWVLTWHAERVLTKRRIMELYLNFIEWGDGVYGAGAASWHHFGKDVTSLNREECARLASIIPNPRRYRADGDSKYVVRRAALVLLRMNARQRPLMVADTSAVPADTLAVPEDSPGMLEPVPFDIDTISHIEDDVELP